MVIELKKVFLSGDDTFPLYHPIKPVRKELYSIFHTEPFSVTLDTEHFEGMEVEDLQRFDMVVLYNDHWNDKIRTSHQLVQAFVHYVAEGGNLLVLHNPDMGIAPELAQMIGCQPMRPLEKPREADLRFVPDGNHPALKGIAPFSLHEELFSLYYSPFTERRELVSAHTEDGEIFPAGWTVEFGQGKTAYLTPGHDRLALRNKEYRKLLRQVAEWMTGLF